MAICSIIFDGMFYPERGTLSLPLIQDKDVRKALDSHCMEAPQVIEEFFKRIMSLHVYVSERPNFWEELKIYTDDRLEIPFLFNVCRRICPDDSDIWYIASWIYKYLIRYYERKDPLKFEEYLNLAERFLTKAVELDPKRKSAWNSLAEIYFKKKEYDKALECYTKCLELAEFKASFWDRIARVYEAKGDVEKALDCMRMALDCMKNSGFHPTPSHLLRLAKLLAKLKRREEALQAIDEADKNRLERGRKYSEWELEELYHAYSELGEYEKCAEVLGNMIAIVREDLLKGAKVEWVKKRLEKCHLLASEMLTKIIKKPAPKQQKKELLTVALERMMEYFD